MRALRLLFVLSVPAGLSAQDVTAEIAQCAAIEGALQRLDCFDQLARELGVDSPQPASPADGVKVGSWEVSDEINPLDDTRSVRLGQIAESGQSSMGSSIALVLMCQSGETDLAINWSDYLGSEVRVTTRVGRQRAETKRWNLSTNSQASFYPDNAREFILTELMNADRFIAQTTPYNENPVTAVFDLTGLSQAIEPLLEACPNA